MVMAGLGCAVALMTATAMSASPRPATTSPTSGQQSPLPIDMAVIGSLGGLVTSVTVHDGVLYAGVGPRLVTARAGFQPEVIGQSEILPDTIWGITVRDGFAYVSVAWYGLMVFDVRSVSSPKLAGQYRPSAAGWAASAPFRHFSLLFDDRLPTPDAIWPARITRVVRSMCGPVCRRIYT